MLQLLQEHCQTVHLSLVIRNQTPPSIQSLSVPGSTSGLFCPVGLHVSSLESHARAYLEILIALISNCFLLC